ASSPATVGCTQAAISLVPADPTFSVCRFLSDQDQPPAPGMKQAPNKAEAESKMLVKLREFDAKFGNSVAGRSPAHN
ncbi:hypothetical protein M441DRAFT_143083, partial [Trichoderma asperellum CBS 433.97]